MAGKRRKRKGKGKGSGSAKGQELVSGGSSSGQQEDPTDDLPKDEGKEVSRGEHPRPDSNLAAGKSVEGQPQPLPTAAPASMEGYTALPRKAPDPPSVSRRNRRVAEPTPLSHRGMMPAPSPSNPKSVAHHRGPDQAGSSGTPLIPKSFAEVAKDKRAIQQQKAPIGRVINSDTKFINFLETYADGEGMGPYYPAWVKLMIETHSPKFEIKFWHILLTDLNLAIDIVNDVQRDKLLLPLVQRFANEKGFDNDACEWITLEILGMPRSIKRFSEYFSKRGCLVKIMNNLLDLELEQRTLSDLAQRLFHGSAYDIFHTHFEDGMSWEGDFGLEDMVLVDDTYVRITKKPSFVFAPTVNGPQWPHAKRKDLHKLESLFTQALDGRLPEARIGDPTLKDLPLFYFVLCEDLLEATDEEVGQRWFVDYILNHPALKPPQCRRNFITSTYQILRNPMSVTQEALQRQRVKERAQQGKKLKESNWADEVYEVQFVFEQEPDSDWRQHAAFGKVEVLRKVYHHNYDEADEKKGGGGEAFNDESKKETALLSRFEFTLWGSLRYNRHLLDHIVNTINSKSIPEMEVFASMKLGPYLCKVIRLMLSSRLNRTERFASIWSDYKSAGNLSINESKVKPGPQLVFWKI